LGSHYQNHITEVRFCCNVRKHTACSSPTAGVLLGRLTRVVSFEFAAVVTYEAVSFISVRGKMPIPRGMTKYRPVD